MSPYISNNNAKRWIRFSLFVTTMMLLASIYIFPSIYNLKEGIITSSDRFVIFVLSAIFPISAYTYYEYRRPSHEARVIDDMGIITGDSLLENWLEKKNPEESDESVKKMYQRIYSGRHYLLMSTVVFFISLIGLNLLFTPTLALSSIMPGEEVNFVFKALRYGFLGAYIYAIQLIFRRYTTMDLQPSVYLSAAFNMIAGMAFNIVAFLAIIKFDTTDSSEGLSAIIAFSLGYFPNLAIRWFNVLAFQALGINQREANRLPLKLIDGISIWHETRLNDNGIDNVQNLASAKVTDLLLHTPFSIEEIVDWIDQAILYLYLSAETITSFRQVGVRTLSDFQTQWKDYYESKHLRKEKDEDKSIEENRNNAALLFQSTPDRLDMLYKAIQEGPNVHHIATYWTNKKLIMDAKHKEKINKVFLLKGKLQDFKDQVIPNILKDTAAMELNGKTKDEIKKKIKSDYADEFKKVENLVIRSIEDKLSFAEYHYYINDYKIARDIYEKVLKEEDKTLAEAENGLARLDFSDEKYTEALAHAKNAIKLVNESPKRYTSIQKIQFLDTLTEIFIKQGKLEEANKKIERMKELKENIDETSDNSYKTLVSQYIDLREKELEALEKQKSTNSKKGK